MRHTHTQAGGTDGLVSTCPPCHYPGGDGGEQRETRGVEGGSGRGAKEGRGEPTGGEERRQREQRPRRDVDTGEERHERR